MEISSLTDGTRIKLRIIDIQGGHYGIVLETQKRHNVLYLGEARGNKLGVIFLEDKRKTLLLQSHQESSRKQLSQVEGSADSRI